MTTFCTSVVLCIILALNKAAFVDTQQQGKCTEQANNAGPVRVGAYIPQCDSDGNFLPQQCWPSTGYCWCVHVISGEEIPGTKTPPGQTPPNCGEIKVKCADQTSRVRRGLLGAYIPQCDSDGNFLPQQCWASTGYCWCVHVISGAEIPGTKTPPGHPPPNCGFVHKWCVTSDQELRKCTDLAAAAPVFSCVKRSNSLDCMQAIRNGEADAVTLDGGDVYTAGLNNYGLQPIIAEDYGPSSDTCVYAVAVVKKDSGFSINELQGKKSCHTGLGHSVGWNIPIGTLLAMGLIQWTGTEDKPLEEAVSEFFSASCAPGATPGSKLCELCSGDCSKSHGEPYYGNAGAYQCLAGCNGDVAFVSHLAVPESEKANYELLCKDGTRKPIDEYQNCHLARVPAHAVVSRRDKDLADLIYASISTVSNFNLFSSEAYAPAKNLMFSDSTVNLTRLPSSIDSLLYLGAEYLSVIRSMRRQVMAPADEISFCAVGHAETVKCDTWSLNSFEEDVQKIGCQVATTVEDCMKKILYKQADAVVMDAGHLYTAGKCGLIPAMVEQYNEDLCSTSGSASSYYAVAVVKKSSGVAWDTLRGKRSCHTGIGRTAGWNIPMGQIYKDTNDCDFTNFFVHGCAPGADPGSPFCSQCVGSGKGVHDEAKCKANADEKYYGFSGAFRCLVEDAGDVAFVKHTTVSEIIDGASPEWARHWKSTDFELICPGKPHAPVTDYVSCHLAVVPAHAVVTRPESRDKVVRILKEQQAKFGNQGSDPTFRMFQSDEGKNLLFKDSTKCLQEVPAGTTYKQFLGSEYVAAMDFLRNCNETVPDLERSCSFHSCLQKD